MTEGVFSMDGDTPDLEGLIGLKREFDTWLMVDEAHSMGVLGRTGRGLAEHTGIDPAHVDLWMGTLSKSFAACGGYIAGRSALVDFLKYTTPGFVYSVGLSPPLAAAALEAIEVMLEEPQRVARLQANARRFREGARAAGLDVGLATEGAVVPILVGSSHRAIVLSQRLFEAGINVEPVVAPAVEQNKSRLRFFLSSEHTPAQIDRAIAALTHGIAQLPARTDVDGASNDRLPAAGQRRVVTDPSAVYPQRARLAPSPFDPHVELANADIVRRRYPLEGVEARYVMPHGRDVIIAGPERDGPWVVHRWRLADGEVTQHDVMARARTEPTQVQQTNIAATGALYRHFVGLADIEVFLDACDPAVRWTVPGPSELFFTGQWRGREGVLEFWRTLAGKMDIHDYWLDAVIPDGDAVYVVGGFHSTSLEHQIAYADPFLHRAEYRDGKLVSFREWFDPVVTLAAYRPDVFNDHRGGAT